MRCGPALVVLACFVTREAERTLGADERWGDGREVLRQPAGREGVPVKLRVAKRAGKGWRADRGGYASADASARARARAKARTRTRTRTRARARTRGEGDWNWSRDCGRDGDSRLEHSLRPDVNALGRLDG